MGVGRYKSFSERFDEFECFYLYGATPVAPSVLELLGKLNKQIAGFVDKSVDKQKVPYLGYPVSSPDEMVAKLHDGPAGIIIVAAYQMEIYQSLIDNGISKDRIFPFLDGMFYPTYREGYVANSTLATVIETLHDEEEQEYLKSWRIFKETGDLSELRPLEGMSVQYAHKAWQESIVPDGVCCDIGAYDGLSSIEFLETQLFSKVIAFEPFLQNYQKLVETVTTQEVGHIIEPRKLAIGASRETIWLNTAGASSRSRITESKEPATDTGDCIEVFSLDSLSIPEITMIKVDIEGHELAFLEGAVQTIRNSRPHIAISAYHEFSHCSAIIEFFEKNFDGFHIMVGHHPHAVYELEYYIYFDVDIA